MWILVSPHLHDLKLDTLSQTLTIGHMIYLIMALAAIPITND